MAKTWKTGDIIPLAHINELEEKAEVYDNLMANNHSNDPGVQEKPDIPDEQPEAKKGKKATKE